ncbi:MAG TPA: hypothetical protein PKI19_07295 [Elusimicrobiales bacterium]|nr:hypothetical protein [Elusimicrobiales bacterium]
MKISLFAVLLSLQAAALSAEPGQALSQLGALVPAGSAQAAPALPAARPAPVKNAPAITAAKTGSPKTASPAGAKEETAGEPAMKMWMALDLMTKFENVALHVINGGTDSLTVESLQCAEDNYAACSMFVTLNGQRKMVVTVDAGAKLIAALAENGFYQEEENWTVGVSRAECSKTGEEYACSFQP